MTATQISPTRRLVSVALALAAVVTLFGIAVQSAQAFVVGVGEQNPRMFTDDRFTRLKIRNARIVVPYDVALSAAKVAKYKPWFDAAARAGVQPLVTLNHADVAPKRLPTVARYTKAFKRFRAVFPQAKTISVWNEANHVSQPTYRSPKRAAQFYDAARKACKSCKLVALTVLDQRGMDAYVKKFLAAAKRRPKIFGLHNYADVNRFRTKGVNTYLKLVKGEVWLTETGGIVSFAAGFPFNPTRAARATEFLFTQAAKQRRLKRVYLYNWYGPPLGHRWDSALVSFDGEPRPAYNVVRRFLVG